MPINKTFFHSVTEELQKQKATLVAVSKTKPDTDIKALYDLGQRDFGENYVQELVEKSAKLPADIHWHFIGHLQSNKVKYIAPFVHLIHAVDSFKLLKEINKEAGKNNRTIPCLLQVHIAQEETKFGLDEKELEHLYLEYKNAGFNHVKVTGLMGMASFTDNMEIVRQEFKQLKSMFDRLQKDAPDFGILSMGMSSDYLVALEEGSNLVRIGSLLFGERN
ncbi:MAG TPA: YggS family pyridoxal phosphate-dependent enzyme [Chitinophagaceae bacterium]|nr:YggS family pyridoxal phosphate-dependent enzyme [Chitinophagaceae bacterium]MCB9055796.1 YggS family pyridoxal phosphate-dependent enzyme [Chitinophagales bacterium]HRX94952.1 YggS family pyridoxal phosphate-dependent enzyme [Chitinophagaceae bacterium]